jgi:SOS-response transcriptional repressor LexA
MASALRRAPRELGYRGVQVLAMIRERVRTQGRAPSYAEIMCELGFCDEAGVLRVVKRLEQRALISRVGSGKVRRGSRAIRLIVSNK